MATKEDPANNPAVDHQVRKFLAALNSSGGKPMETMTPQEARQVLIDAQKGADVKLPVCKVEERTIKQDNLTVSLHIVRPEKAKPNSPAFMFFHGGGWVLGDFPTHERFVRDLVWLSGYTAIFVNYTPSPEAKYPTAINEAYAATKWVSENGTEIGVDGKNLALVGNSVGGNMAAVVALMCKDKQGPAIKCQILFWPVTDANFETKSYDKFDEGYFLTRDMMKWFWDNYTSDVAVRKEKYASPLQAKLDDLMNLPPALIQTAGNDVLRSEGESYARKLDSAGVPTTITRYTNLIHDYGLLNALAEVPAVKVALDQASQFLKHHLG